MNIRTKAFETVWIALTVAFLAIAIIHKNGSIKAERKETGNNLINFVIK